MKPNLLTLARDPFRVRGFRRPIPALLAGLTLMGGMTFVLHAQLTNIQKSVLLSWQELTEEHIVVGADSPASNAVWTPWPEPIFKRFGALCMTAPTVATQQFFKLVPGRQFVDDFSDTWGPFTNRNSWTGWLQEAGEEWTVTNGVLQVDWRGPGYGFALCPLGTNAQAHLRDTFASVDILDWNTSGTNKSVFSLGARVQLSGQAYHGALGLNADGIRGKIRPFLGTAAGLTYGSDFDMQLKPPPYRLQVSVVGARLSLRVLNPTTGQDLIPAVTTNMLTLTEGFMGFWIEGGTNPADSFTIKADNFFLTGTKP